MEHINLERLFSGKPHKPKYITEVFDLDGTKNLDLVKLCNVCNGESGRCWSIHRVYHCRLCDLQLCNECSCEVSIVYKGYYDDFIISKKCQLIVKDELPLRFKNKNFLEGDVKKRFFRKIV